MKPIHGLYTKIKSVLPKFHKEPLSPTTTQSADNSNYLYYVGRLDSLQGNKESPSDVLLYLNKHLFDMKKLISTDQELLSSSRQTLLRKCDALFSNNQILYTTIVSNPSTNSEELQQKCHTQNIQLTELKEINRSLKKDFDKNLVKLLRKQLGRFDIFSQPYYLTLFQEIYKQKSLICIVELIQNLLYEIKRND